VILSVVREVGREMSNAPLSLPAVAGKGF